MEPHPFYRSGRTRPYPRLRVGRIMCLATLTGALAQALIATARTERDADDELASRTFNDARAARHEISRLLGTAPLGVEDLATIRSALERQRKHLEGEQELRLAEHRAGGSSETVRLGLGWLERYLVAGRWGPYLRLRWREENGRKRMEYIGKLTDWRWLQDQRRRVYASARA